MDRPSTPPVKASERWLKKVGEDSPVVLAETAAQVTSWSKVRDLLSLAKPRLSLLVIITMVGGIGFAPVAMEPLRMLVAVLTTAIIVGGANALNCVIERERDAQMRRTRQRPLAAGRVGPREALLSS